MLGQNPMMKANTKKLLAALFFLMTPWLMAFTLSFILPNQLGWLGLLQSVTLMMACGTSAAGGMCAWAFIHREVQDLEKWENLGVIVEVKA